MTAEGQDGDLLNRITSFSGIDPFPVDEQATSILLGPMHPCEDTENTLLCVDCHTALVNWGIELVSISCHHDSVALERRNRGKDWAALHLNAIYTRRSYSSNSTYQMHYF